MAAAIKAHKTAVVTIMSHFWKQKRMHSMMSNDFLIQPLHAAYLLLLICSQAGIFSEKAESQAVITGLPSTENFDPAGAFLKKRFYRHDYSICPDESPALGNAVLHDGWSGNAGVKHVLKKKCHVFIWFFCCVMPKRYVYFK